MEIRELRIGNKVDLYGKIATVCQSDFSTGLAITEGKPIPLTEEWLLKFGFEKDEISNFGGWLSPETNNHRLRVNINNGICNYSTGYHFIEIKYIHRLQNLYFVLTGKEL